MCAIYDQKFTCRMQILHLLFQNVSSMSSATLKIRYYLFLLHMLFVSWSSCNSFQGYCRNCSPKHCCYLGLLGFVKMREHLFRGVFSHDLLQFLILVFKTFVSRRHCLVHLGQTIVPWISMKALRRKASRPLKLWRKQAKMWLQTCSSILIVKFVKLSICS